MTDQKKMLNRFEPPADNPITQPYWDATRDKKLLLQRCVTTGKFQFFPRALSIHELGGDVEWVESPGNGVVYSFSVMHRPANPMMKDKVPYAVGLIELDEGVRMMSNIINIDVSDIKVGMKVKLAWEALSDGRHLPLFEPA